MNNEAITSLAAASAPKESFDEPSSHWMRFFWWLKRLIYLWVKSKSFPNNIEELSIDTQKPVCYVLSSHSITDLLVLDNHCQKMNLPEPRYDLHELNRAGKGAYLYLAKTGLFQKKRGKTLPAGLFKLIEKVDREKKDIQLIPVSVFWGRNAGKEEKSLFKLLFFDDEHGGWLQRFFLFFAQGRNVFCSFGKPISVLDFLEQEKDLVGATKKLRRVLRVHFHRQREVTVGPYIFDRRKMTSSILNSKSLRQFFEQEVEKKGKSREKLEEQARRYVDEIAAKQSPHVVRFFDVVLTWVFNKVYGGIEIRHGESLRNYAETHEIVYLPCHRSHMDYLLINYSLYSMGVQPPHTAAGVNLNFWPVGPLFRMGGAFFIRRSFGGNRLYGAVFTEYVNFLLTNGYPLCFYIEGGRSRTGRLLQPKLGMISMVVKSYQENPAKPILLIPTFIAYDKLMEARSYFHELKGKTKRAESIWALFRAPKILAYEFGKAYINFGEPIDLNTYLTQASAKPKEDVATSLSRDVMRHINRAISVTPVSLFAVALLALPRRAIAEVEIVNLVKAWVALLRAVPYDVRTNIPDAEAGDLLKLAEKLAHFNRFEHISGDVIYVNEKDCAFLNYYRSNVLPIFVVPSLIANLFSYYQAIDLESLIKVVLETYRLLKDDYFLKWKDEDVPEAIAKYVDAMANLGLLIVKDGKITAPNNIEVNSFHLRTLGRVVGNVIERFCLYISVLSEKETSEKIAVDAFTKECDALAKKSAILNGYHEFDYFDKNECRHFIETLCDLGYITKHDGILEILEGAKTCFNNLSPLSNAISKNLRGSGKEVYERSERS